MNIPQGYKQTELGVIPEEWEVVKLGNLGVTYTGLSGKRKVILAGALPNIYRFEYSEQPSN